MNSSVEVRVQELLSDPPQAVYRLGATDRTGESILRILDESGTATKNLREVNEQLIPLIALFKLPGRAGKWWRKFTGEELEREVSFGYTCRQIESLAAMGVKVSSHLSQLHTSLEQEHCVLGLDQQLLETDVQAGNILLSTAPAALAFAQALDEESIQRFARKLTNVEAVLTALQLTRSQYLVAAQHAKEMVDRFDEIRTLLVPLWYQRVGFELFSKRVNAD